MMPETESSMRIQRSGARALTYLFFFSGVRRLSKRQGLLCSRVGNVAIEGIFVCSFRSKVWGSVGLKAYGLQWGSG